MSQLCKANFYFTYLLIAFATTLFGCGSIPENQPQLSVNQTAEQRAAQLMQLQHWTIKGKIAFIEKNNRSGATLSWSVNEKSRAQELNLTTYLGISVLNLISNADNHTIEFDGKRYHSHNLEELIQSITGLSLPTDALTYWLKGTPYLANDVITFHEVTELPTKLTSNYNNEEWQITYANYKRFDGFNLATKFAIKKDNLLIKIVINDWLIADK